MGGKFEVLAGKQYWKLVDRLFVMVYFLGLRCWLADWQTRDATAEVVSCSAAAAPAAVRRVHQRVLAVLPPGHGLSRYLWAPRCLYVTAMVVLGGKRSCPDRSRGTFAQWQNLTGHIAYKLFDRLPVKYVVPILYAAKITVVAVAHNSTALAEAYSSVVKSRVTRRPSGNNASSTARNRCVAVTAANIIRLCWSLRNVLVDVNIGFIGLSFQEKSYAW